MVKELLSHTYMFRSTASAATSLLSIHPQPLSIPDSLRFCLLHRQRLSTSTHYITSPAKRETDLPAGECEEVNGTVCQKYINEV